MERDWFSKNSILRPNSIVTQLKLPSLYAPPPSRFRPDADARPPSALRVVLGSTLLWFLEYAQSPLRTFMLCGYVKMAASVLNVLLRRLPNISPFRGAYGVQVTPWGTFCTTSDLFVPSGRLYLLEVVAPLPGIQEWRPSQVLIHWLSRKRSASTIFPLPLSLLSTARFLISRQG